MVLLVLVPDIAAVAARLYPRSHCGAFCENQVNLRNVIFTILSSVF
jgi:hypothetical protein